MNNNRFIIFTLIFTLLFGQTALFADYTNPLFKLPAKAFKNVERKVYQWDDENYKMEEDSDLSLAYLNSQNATEYIIQNLKDLNKDKVVLEYNYDNNYDSESAINYQSLQNMNNFSGKNEYSTTIKNTSYKDSSYGSVDGITNIDKTTDTDVMAKFFTLVTNLGQKGRTYGVRTWESETAKKLYIEGFRVNYIDMYRKEIKNYCFQNQPIPSILTSIPSVLGLTGSVNGEVIETEDLEKMKQYPGLIDLRKTQIALDNDGKICELGDSDLGEMLFQTGLFYKNGDLRLNNKDYNQNVALASSATADAIYFNNGIDASLIYDKDWDIKHHKKKKKWFKEKHWLTLTTTSGWYKIVPFSFLSDKNNFGSYSVQDVNVNTTKISGLFPQVSTVNGNTVTPDGHSINFSIIPVVKHDNLGIGEEPLKHGSTYYKSATKNMWASWVLTVLVIIIIVIAIVVTVISLGTAGPAMFALVGASISVLAAGIAAVGIVFYLVAFTVVMVTLLAVALYVRLITFALQVKDEKLDFNKANMNAEKMREADFNSMIDRYSFKEIKNLFNEDIKGALIKGDNTDMFWDSALDNGSDVFQALSGKGDYANYSGTMVHTMMKDSTTFWKSHHIKDRLSFFNKSVNLNEGANKNLFPLTNFRFLLNKVTEKIDTTFIDNQGGSTTNTNARAKTSVDLNNKLEQSTTEAELVNNPSAVTVDQDGKTELEVIEETRGRIQF